MRLGLEMDPLFMIGAPSLGDQKWSIVRGADDTPAKISQQLPSVTYLIYTVFVSRSVYYSIAVCLYFPREPRKII